MTRRRPGFLLIFVTPLILATLVASVIGYFSLEDMKSRQQIIQAEVAQFMTAVNSTVDMGNDMLAIHQTLADMLAQADQGKLSEAQAYRIHSRLVDQLGQLDVRSTALLARTEGLNQSLRDATHETLDAYQGYRSYIVMASDIVAIDPKVAHRYIEDALRHYTHYVGHAQTMTSLLTREATEQLRRMDEQRESFVRQSLWTAALCLGALWLLWLLGSWWFTRHLDTIARALGRLSYVAQTGGTGMQLDAPTLGLLHHMTQSDRGALSHLAHAVLAFARTIDARQQALNALAEEQHTLKTLVRGMPDLVWLKDPDGVYLMCNQRFESLNNRSEADIIGKTDYDLYPTELANFFRANDLKAMALGHASLNEERLTFASDQHQELVETIKTPIYDRYGELMGVLGVARDITAARNAENALRESEEALKRSQQVARIGSWHYDMTTRLNHLSDESCRIFGLPEGSPVRARDFADLVHPDDRELVQQAWLKVMHGQPTTVEHRILLQGKVRWVREFGEPHLDEHGRVLWIEGVAQDVTELQQASEALRKRDQIYSTIMSQAGSGIVLIDFDNFGFVEFNDAACDMLGYSRDEFSRLTVYDIQGHRTREELDALAQQVVNAGSLHYETVQKRKDGSAIDVAVSTRVIEVDGRRYLSSMWSDITQRKENERDLLRFQTHLQEMVAERTAELAAAKEAAEAANQTKSAFLANMSHEIRTPMNAIIGLTHLVRRDTQDERQRSQLDKIKDAAHHLLGIINDILDFSKIEAGRMSLDPTDFEVEHVIRNMCSLVTDRAEAKGLELVTDIAELPEMLHGDGLRLGQVLVNFVGNAIKFTAEGSVVVHGRVIRWEGDTCWARFEVRDTGIGLSEEQQSRLFQAFSQADISTTRRFGGTGLGLVICKRLAEMMGGTVGVQSTLGHGSVFWIDAPFKAVQRHPRHEHHHRLPPGLRVLVVDDLPEACESMLDSLRGIGAHADAVHSGELALAHIQQADELRQPYQVVLIDWTMPGMDGLQTAQQLMQLPLLHRPSTFLVSSTREVPPGTLERGGFQGFIGKPITPSMLTVALENKVGIDPQTLAPVAEANEAEQALAARGTTRLLLVEDNPLNQEVALELLTHAGLSVDVANDGLEAIERTAHQHYDLILMDLQMPRLDGFEATRRIRTQPEHATTPILAMTANAFEEDRQQCLDAGMNDHIPKPVDPEVLYSTLLRWLPPVPEGASPAGAPAPNPTADPENPAEHDALMQKLQAVPGLHLDQALRNVLGRPPRLASLLQRFATEHSGDAERLREQLQQQDMEAAQRLAHTLKGVSGTLGLSELQTLAADLEARIKHGQNAAACQDALAALTQGIEHTLPHLQDLATHLPARQAPNPATLAPQLNELRQLLAMDDVQATDLFATLEPSLKQLHPAATSQMAQDMANYSLDQALITLDALLQEIPALQTPPEG